jgi:hypothetical protein
MAIIIIILAQHHGGGGPTYDFDVIISMLCRFEHYYPTHVRTKAVWCITSASGLDTALLLLLLTLLPYFHLVVSFRCRIVQSEC